MNQNAAVAQPGSAATDQASEAPLKQAWENAFGPLPKPEDFALARVDNPTVALPGVGLPGIGVNAVTIAPSIGGGALAGAAVPTVAPALGLPQGLPPLPQGLPPLPQGLPPLPQGLPPLPAAPQLPQGLPPLPGPPPMPCVGFGTPIPFVGFSTC